MFTVCFCLLVSVAGVIGNTEIINFSVENSITAADLAFTKAWPVLSSDPRTLQMNITSARALLPKEVCRNLSQWTASDGQHCPHELWLVLDLNATIWRKFKKFTLRLSWPAFHPTDITMNILDPLHLSALRPVQNHDDVRLKYARIQFVHSGILTPSSQPLNDISRYRLPIIITLEPLHLNVIPESVIPITTAIILVTLAGLCIASKVNAYLQPIAKKARDECECSSKTK